MRATISEKCYKFMKKSFLTLNFMIQYKGVIVPALELETGGSDDIYYK